MITCKDIPGIASDYISHEGSRRLRFLTGLHLAQCTHCRGYVRGLKRLRTLAAESLAAEPVSLEMMQRLTARFGERG